MSDRSAQLDADYELMQRVSLDDESAVSELYDRFGPLVYRMAHQMMPTRSDAEDAVQEIFVRLWRTAGRYDPKRAALVTWVMMLSRRILVDRLRRQKARIKASTMNDAIPPVASGAAVGTEIERDERFAALMKKIEQLPELQRIVVTRSYLDGMTLRQIGIELNKPLGTIKSALSRALVRLRERGNGEEMAA